LFLLLQYNQPFTGPNPPANIEVIEPNDKCCISLNITEGLGRTESHIVMAKFPIPENCSAYVPMILKEFCSSKINGLVMKNFFRGSTFPGNMHNYIWCTCNPCFGTFDIQKIVFHGLKTGFFCYSLKLNFICYPNKLFTYDYSLWDGGDIRFCGEKQTLIII
jgi:hypothetical protein